MLDLNHFHIQARLIHSDIPVPDKSSIVCYPDNYASGKSEKFTESEISLLKIMANNNN